MINEHHVRPQTDQIAHERLNALRQQMQTQGLDAYLLPRSDEYQGEYVPPHAMRLAWLTGFTGSAGAVLVLSHRAIMFVDGRYTLQVQDQTDTTLYHHANLSWDQIGQTISANLESESAIGYDAALWTENQIKNIQNAIVPATDEGAEYSLDWHPLLTSLIDKVWQDAPPKPQEPVEIHPLSYAGEASADKIQRVIDAMDPTIDALYLSLPEDICWLLNVRGKDVPCTPLVLSTALLHRDGSLDWFIDRQRLGTKALEHVGQSVRTRQPDTLSEVIQSCSDAAQDNSPTAFKVGLDAQQTSAKDSQIIAASAALIRTKNPITALKAIKNKTEQQNAATAHIIDGLALTEFLYWLENHALEAKADELMLESKLYELRARSDRLRGISFETIVGSGPHGAIVHYRVTPDTNRALEANDMVLIDSGGQYAEGTTDVTRTLSLGNPTAEQIKRFTQVLKGHIQLAMARFPENIHGAHLDILARKALWADGVDYAHGTGHGVGSYLSVHEGPQSISLRSQVPLKAGMICSNEPGYYKDGEYGIRIENLVLIRPVDELDSDKTMLEFQTLTLAPIQKKLIDKNALTQEEIQWLDHYHQRVFDTYQSRINHEYLDWLRDATSALAS